MRIYKIETNLTNSKNQDLLSNLTSDDEKYLSTLEMKLSVDLVDSIDEKICTVLVCNVINLEKLKTFLSDKNINFDVEDITSEFTSEENEEKLVDFLEDISTEDIYEKFGINS